MVTSAWSTSYVADVLDALCTQLAQRTGLTGVTVLSAPMAEDTPPTSIVFGSAEANQEWDALGNRGRVETIELDGSVWIVRGGAGDQVAKAARDEAFRIVGEIEQQLRDDWRVGLAPVSAEMAQITLGQGINPHARWCEIAFVIRARVQLRGIRVPESGGE